MTNIEVFTPATPDETYADQLASEIDALGHRLRQVRQSIGRVIFGQHKTIEQTLITLLAGGHALLIGVPAAYSLSRWRFYGRRQVALWILATRMAPPIAFTIPFFLAYRWLGLLDTVAGLVLIYLTFNLALVIWMMQTFFESVPKQLEEAAWIERHRARFQHLENI